MPGGDDTITIDDQDTPLGNVPAEGETEIIEDEPLPLADMPEEEEDTADEEEEETPPLAVEAEEEEETVEIEDEEQPLASPSVIAGAKHCIFHFLELILAGGTAAYGVGSGRKEKKKIDELKKGKRG